MGLKQDIVIKNQFSVRTPKGGTRGGTPGAYVERYMARRDASEPLAPARVHDVDGYIERYMAREAAVERAGTPEDAERGIERADGRPRAGVAFDAGSVSMSSEAVRRRSKEIQAAFDSGKVVLKTVISFDGGYLARSGVCDEGFVPHKKGDWRGHVDQLKLRRAIQNGMRRLSAYYDDLTWIGVIQVDTMHVHAHIAAVDKGRGRLRRDGTQSGTLTPRMMDDLRRGIDLELDRLQSVRQLSAQTGHDRQEARALVKRYTHAAMGRGGIGQFLMACLPSDRRRWRAGSAARDMRQANAACEAWVRAIFDAEPAAWQEAERSVLDYATSRREREGLSDDEFRRLVDDGSKRLMDGCMNAVYQVLRDVPRSRAMTETATLDLMTMDLSDMASTEPGDPAVEFGVRLRSYSERLEHHKAKRQRFHELAEDWERRREVTPAVERSRSLHEWFREEEDYHERLMCKYQHFLSFLPSADAYGPDIARVQEHARDLADLEAIRDDDRVADMGSDLAEAFCRSHYHQTGGHVAAKAPDVFARRVQAARESLERELAALRFQLEADALRLDEEDLTEEEEERRRRRRLEERGRGRADDVGVDLGSHDEDDYAREHAGKRRPTFEAVPAVKHDFDDVKALDIHHLAIDFPFGTDVTVANVRAFTERAHERGQALSAAEAYLARTGQTFDDATEARADVDAMLAETARLSEAAHLDGIREAGAGMRHVRTTSLDVDVTDDVHAAVMRSVEQARRSMPGPE